MIIEALAFATQRAAPGARATGVAAEQAAIVARYIRCRRAWLPHLARCRAFVQSAVARTRQRRRAVVLGSGPLLDIPLAALSAAFDEVILVDAVHPLHARLAARRLGNVVALPFSLVAHGASPPTYRSWRHAVAGADIVVASMLLSQLPPPRATDPRAGWRRALVADALADLGAGGEAACLVTETACVIHGPGEGRSEEDPLHGVPAPPALERWQWALAPPGERGDGAEVVLQVSACLRLAGEGAWLG